MARYSEGEVVNCEHGTVTVITGRTTLRWKRHGGYWINYEGHELDRIECEDCGEDLTEQFDDEIQDALKPRYGVR